MKCSYSYTCFILPAWLGTCLWINAEVFPEDANLAFLSLVVHGETGDKVSVMSERSMRGATITLGNSRISKLNRKSSDTFPTDTTAM